jgi:hypothetical protein
MFHPRASGTITPTGTHVPLEFTLIGLGLLMLMRKREVALFRNATRTERRLAGPH